MKKINYREYITSADWIKKKTELFSIYMAQGWPIRCSACHSTQNLHVHHRDYKEIGNENLSEEASKAGRGIYQLDILCNEHHRRLHTDPAWKRRYENYELTVDDCGIDHPAMLSEALDSLIAQYSKV